MPSILPSAKAQARFLSARNGGFGLIRRSLSLSGLGRSDRFYHARGLSSIAQIGNSSIDFLVDGGREVGSSNGSLYFKSQSRGLLWVGDGLEGDVLSKVYEERKVMGYSPEQLFAVVAAVDLYEDFVPWCQRSKILK